MAAGALPSLGNTMSSDKFKSEEWFGDGYRECERELDWANADASALGRARRMHFNNVLADAHYKAAEIFKSRGDEKNAWAAHDKANEYWGKVVAESGIYDEPDRNDDTALTPEEAARVLYRSRGGI